MNQLLKQLLVCVYLFALTGQAAADSFSDAKSAYDADDYAKAAKLSRPLAEQGNAVAQKALGGCMLMAEVYRKITQNLVVYSPTHGNSPDFR